MRYVVERHNTRPGKGVPSSLFLRLLESGDPDWVPETEAQHFTFVEAATLRLAMVAGLHAIGRGLLYEYYLTQRKEKKRDG